VYHESAPSIGEQARPVPAARATARSSAIIRYEFVEVILKEAA
jgi:hypothetical protein